MLEVIDLYKSYLPEGEKVISGCGTSIMEKRGEVDMLNEHNAVNHISFYLQKGEILSILGENGSGKSTLLKLLAGLLEKDGGKILFQKKEVTGPSKNLVPSHPEIKLIHQNFNLFPNISLEENIRYALRFEPLELQNKTLNELIELSHLEEIKDKLPRQVSGGEQQRTAIATALAYNAKLILLDEPFSNLDVFNKRQLKKHILKIARKKKVGIIFVTHDASDALSVSDRILVIKNGSILQTGTPSEIYHHPKNPYVASISGDVNIFNHHHLTAFNYEWANRGFKRNQKFALRPEHIRISETREGLKGVVRNIYYQGAFSIVKAEIKKGFEISFYDYQTLYKEDEEVYLNFDPDSLIVLNQ